MIFVLFHYGLDILLMSSESINSFVDNVLLSFISLFLGLANIIPICCISFSCTSLARDSLSCYFFSFILIIITIFINHTYLEVLIPC